MNDRVDYTWRGPITDDDMVELVESHGGMPDFEPHLSRFYFDACGFVPTDAGLIRLSSLGAG